MVRLFAIITLILSTLSAPAHAVGSNAGLPPLSGSLNADLLIYRDYVSSFVMKDGRVIDNINGNISHSESQGYGMLLAVAAQDQETFKLIWDWTDRALFIRDDGLAAWRYEPEGSVATAETGKITDMNNATDGDLLIAWALAEAAAMGWDPLYAARAETIIDAMAPLLVNIAPFGLQMMPAAAGFDAEAQAGLPVVNLSYWVFPAFDRLAELHPRPFWQPLQQSGRSLLRISSRNLAGLSPDWVALDSENKTAMPAGNFENNGFSYNAIRIPLYLAMSSTPSRRELRAGFEQWFSIDGPLWTVDVAQGRGMQALSDPGYEMLRSVYACATRGTAIPETLRRSLDVNYYPATLQLLGLAGVAMRYPQCMK